MKPGAHVLVAVVGVGAVLAFAIGCDGEVEPEPAATAEESEVARLDPCPSAVLAGAGRPMQGSCSTRDGRSRVAGPSAPHLRWLTKVSPRLFGVLAADASDGVYVFTSFASSSAYGSMLARYDGSTGTPGWSSLVPDAVPSTPVILGNGAVTVAGQSTSGAYAYESASALTGSLTEALIPDQSTVSADGFDPAVGVDGSLYMLSNPLKLPGAFVTRIAPDGTASWTSPDLRPDALRAPASSYERSPVALGPGDVVVSTLWSTMGTGAVVALDPATGATEWTSTLPPGFGGGPVVAPDGSVLVLIGTPTGGPGATALRILEPTGALRQDVDLTATGYAGVGIACVGKDGTVVLGAQSNAGDPFLMALGPSRNVVWVAPASQLVKVTIDERGTVVAAMATEIEGLDLATGAVTWTLPSPNPRSEIVDATLTSGGAVVAIEQDGTLFGATD